MRYRLNRFRRFYSNVKFARVLLLFTLLGLIILGISLYNSLVSENALDSIKFAAVTEIGECMNAAVSDFFENHPDFSENIIVGGESKEETGSFTSNAELLDAAEKEIYDRLCDLLEKNDVIRVRIPIGTLTKNKYLSGKGFKVTVSAYIVPAITSEIDLKVESAGINQTMYTATLTIEVDCQLIFGSQKDSVNCVTKKNIFTKILVGEVPLGSK